MDNYKIKKGKYKHYKDLFYEVIDTAKHSENLEDMVVYRELYGKNNLWVRPLGMFLSYVEIDGKERKRYEFISEVI